MILDEERLGRTARIANYLGQARRLGVLAPEADGENSADVRVARQGKHQADGVLVVVAAWKADDVGIGLTLRDGVGDKLRALHGVHHQQQIADTFASVRAFVAGPMQVRQIRCVTHSASRFSRPILRPIRRSRGRAYCGSCAGGPTRPR